MLMLLLVAALQGAAAPGPDDGGSYIVGPNDVLSVSVYNQAQMSGKYAVEADGTITFPLLGRVAVGGLGVRAVEDAIRQRLAGGFLNDPQVSVTVDQYRSQQIFVMGEVRQPGPLQFTGSMTLIEALARVGSTTERAGAEAVIVRSSGRSSQAATDQPNGANPNAKTIKVDLQRLQSGALVENVALHAGDTVFVPRAETLFVSGQVRTPGEYVFRTGMTVRQALALAGGVTDRGSTRRINLIRVVKGEEVRYDAELQDHVQPGDTIVVNERFF